MNLLLATLLAAGLASLGIIDNVNAQSCSAAIFLAKGGRELQKYSFHDDTSTRIARFGGPFPMQSIALNPKDGFVYGFKNNGDKTSINLIRINPRTGKRRSMGRYGIGNVQPMAIDEDGRIFVQSHDDYFLYEISLNGTYAPVGEMYYQTSLASPKYPFLAQGLAIQGNRWVTIGALKKLPGASRFLVVGKLPPKYSTLGLIRLRGIPKDLVRSSSTLMFEPVGARQLYIGDNKKRTMLWRFHGPSSDTLRQTTAVNRVSAGFFTDCHAVEDEA